MTEVGMGVMEVGMVVVAEMVHVVAAAARGWSELEVGLVPPGHERATVQGVELVEGGRGRRLNDMELLRTCKRK
jgi:hypothetical protein